MNLESMLNEEEPHIDDTPLKFGKYKGETPNEISQIDPRYLAWFCQTVEGADTMMSEDLFEEYVNWEE